MTKQQKFLHTFANVLAVATAILLFAGGLVTSTGSGLSVPDWPLSYGKFFPPMVGGVRFEHSHRMIAGAVGILTFIFTILIFKMEKRSWLKKLSLVLSLAVLAQAILGGLTVRYLLPTPISVAHACLGQTFFALVVCACFFLSSKWAQSPALGNSADSSYKIFAMILAALFYLQLIAGAFVRHSEGRGVEIHITLAVLILLTALFNLFRVHRSPILKNLFSGDAITLCLLVFFQLFLGLGTYVILYWVEKKPMSSPIEVIFRTTHQTNGAFILALGVLSTVKAFRVFRRG